MVGSNFGTRIGGAIAYCVFRPTETATSQRMSITTMMSAKMAATITVVSALQTLDGCIPVGVRGNRSELFQKAALFFWNDTSRDD